jgi:hypothetical protein
VSELASDGIPVAVTYRWLRTPVTDTETAEAYRANALFDAHRDDRSSATASWSKRPSSG